MISIQNIQIAFGGETLFENVTITLNAKERVGLAGKNGAGKTTLLRIIAGDLEAQKGSVILPEAIETGYLPQEKKIKSKLTVIEETLTVFQKVLFLERELERLSNEITLRTDFETKQYLQLIEKLDEINHQLRILNIEKSEGSAEKVLKGLGFSQTDFTTPVKTFSLGWQMRIELAKLLLQQPGLLLLDEPTNHLDIDSIQWLEQYLVSYRGTVLLVSHDRSFLDNLTTRTLEINNKRIFDYKVPYSHYIHLRNERIDQQKSAYNNQQKQIRDIENFIERFRYKATKAKQVQSRVKQLQKMDTVVVDDLDSSAIHFAFPPAPRSGKVAVEGIELSKSYGTKQVFNKIEFQIIRGEKLAFVGRNGEGKSTLSKIIAQKMDYEGILKFGHNIQIGYYAQDQWEMLDGELSVFETLDNIAVGDIRKRLTNILGSFLFQGDDIHKKVKVLSGGEKARLSLAKLLLSPTNLLILDEPTNHLDLLTKDILKNALIQYNGTLVIVSHDRDFLKGLTTRLYEFGKGQIKEFRGDVLEYLEKRKLDKLALLEQKGETVSQAKKISANKISWEEKKRLDKQIRKTQNKIGRKEAEIEKQEQYLEILQQKLSNPEQFSEEIKSGSLYKQHDEQQALLQTLYQQWENLQEQLEELQVSISK